MDIVMQMIPSAANLLLDAAQTIQAHIRALKGPLERNVETAGAACWDIREKPVQIKGRLFRSKHLIVEEPVFLNDAEQAFGDELDRWQLQGAGAVAAAAVELKTAEQRLMLAAHYTLQRNSPQEQLAAIEALASVHGALACSVAASSSEGVGEAILHNEENTAHIETSIQLTERLVLQLGLKYIGQEPANGVPEGRAMADVAAVLVSHHACSIDWAMGLMQPSTMEDTVVILERLVHAPPLTVKPRPLLQLLAQLEWSSSSMTTVTKELAVRACRALCVLAPTSRQGDPQYATVAHRCVIVICRLMLGLLWSRQQGDQAAQGDQKEEEEEEDDDDVLFVAAAESLLSLLLASAKGISTSELHSQLGLSLERNPSSIQAVSMQSMLTWVLSPWEVTSSNGATIVSQLLTLVPWQLLASRCFSSALRLRWLVGAVAAVKSMAGTDGSPSQQRSALDRGMKLLESEMAWQLADTSNNDASKQDARVLCLAQLTQAEEQGQLSEVVAVTLRHLQVLVGLRSCIDMSRGSGAAENETESAAQLFTEARLEEGLQLLANSGRADLTATYSIRVLESIAGTPGFLQMLPHLANCFQVGMLSQKTRRQMVRTVAQAGARAVRKCVEAAQQGRETDLPSDDANTAASHFRLATALLGVLAASAAVHDHATDDEEFLAAVSNMAQACLSLLRASSTTDNGLLAFACTLSYTVRMIPQIQMDTAVSRLLASQRYPWASVAGAWMADAAVLRSSLTATSDASLIDLTTAFVRDASSTETAASEVFQLREALSGITKQAEHAPAAAVLWHELFLRVSRFPDALQPLLSREDLVIELGSTAHALFSSSQPLATAVSGLGVWLEPAELRRTAATPADILPFVGSQETLFELANMDLEWERWAAGASSSTSSSTPPTLQITDAAAEPSTVGQPQSVEHNAAGGVCNTIEAESERLRHQHVLPGRAQSADRSSIDFTRQQQEEAKSSLEAAAISLRAWVRRSEKRAAQPEGEEAPPAQGREGDVPSPLAAAQSALWEAQRKWDEEFSRVHAELRRRVCQRYDAVDIEHLQATADVYEDGQRIPRQLRDPNHRQACHDLRAQARSIALGAVHAKEVAVAARELCNIEYYMMATYEQHARDSSFSAGSATSAKHSQHEEDSIRSRLFDAVAGALVDGSTPPAASSFLIGVIERATSSIASESLPLTEDAKLRLVPRLARKLAPGGMAPLPGAEALRLLKACINPDALLDAGKLTEVFTLLQHLERLNRTSETHSPTTDARHDDVGVETHAAASILMGFDAQRFALLVAERYISGGKSAANFDAMTSSTAGSSRPSRQKHSEREASAVGIDEIFGLAAAFLRRSETASTGAALIEGVVQFAPAPFFAVALGTVLAAPAFPPRDALFGTLSNIPGHILSEPIVAEALQQLSEALHARAVVPPMLPLDLLASLYNTDAVLQSLEASLLVEEGTATADKRQKTKSAESSRGMPGARAWTVHLQYQTHLSSLTGYEHPSQRDTEGVSGANAEGLDQGGSSGRGRVRPATMLPRVSLDPSRPTPATQDLVEQSVAPAAVLHPISASHKPIADLFEDVIRSMLESLLHSLQCGSVDVSLMCDVFQGLLSCLFEVVGQQGEWALEWSWKKLYVNCLHAFLQDAIPATGMAAATTFRQFWASLPWHRATFLHKSPAEIALIRALLPSADGAALELLQAMDWSVIAALAQPPERKGPMQSSRVSPVIRPSSIAGRTGAVFTLTDDEDVEESTVESHPSQSASHTTLQPGDTPDRQMWATELCLLVLHAQVLAQVDELPSWVSSLVQPTAAHGSGTRGSQITPLVPLMASSDWNKVHAVCFDTSFAPAPWLIMPLLLAPQIIRGDAANRVVSAALILCEAAKEASSPVAAATAAQCIRPLFGMSICQGIFSEQHSVPRAGVAGSGSSGTASSSYSAAAAAAAAAPPQQQLLQIPSDIPQELLEGTVEGEQLRLQQEEMLLREEQAAEEAATAHAGEIGAGATHAIPMVEVSACFRLAASHHVALMQHGLGPLARSHASESLLRSITNEECFPLQEDTLSSQELGGLKIWERPRLPTSMVSLQQASASTPSAAAPCIALLELFVCRPLTLYIPQQMSYGNAEVPWDGDAAVFISQTGGQPSSMQGSSGSMRALRARIASMLHRSESANTQTNQSTAAELDATVADKKALSGLLSALVEAECTWNLREAMLNDFSGTSAALAACLVRIFFFSPPLQGSALASVLAECLLRRLAMSPTGYDGALLTQQQQQHPYIASRTSDGALVRGQKSAALVTDGVAVVPITPISDQGPTITRMEEPYHPPSSSTEPSQHPLADSPQHQAPKTMRLAIDAASSSSLDATHLLSVARTCGAMKRPLLSAFALERARIVAATLDLSPWQEAVVEALDTAASTDAHGEHPLEVLAVWLELLAWLSDSRWRRLPSGPHKTALLRFLQALDERVAVMQLLTVEGLAERQSGSWGRGALSAVAGRLKSGGASLLSNHRVDVHEQESPPELADVTSRNESSAMESRQTRGRRLRITEGLRALRLGKEPPTSEPASRQRRIGGGGIGSGSGGTSLPLSYQGLQGLPEPIAEEIEPEESGSSGAGMGHRFSSGLRSFGKQLTSAGTKIARRTAQQGTADDGGGFSVDVVGDTEGINRRKQPPSTSTAVSSPRLSQAAEAERDTIVRLGLAAHAVAAFVRAVLDPRLTRRTVSNVSTGAGGGGEMVGGSSPSATLAAMHTRGNSSLTGSRQFEETQMREMDSVLCAREELDVLMDLAASPLVAARSGLYESFFEQMPALLTVGTSVNTVQAAVLRLLAPGSVAMLAVLRS